MRVLVTGAAGFFGQDVVAAPRAAGHEVRAGLHRAGEPGTVACDVLDATAARAAVTGVDAVCHLAAAERATGVPVEVTRRDAAAGPPLLVADAGRLRAEPGRSPSRPAPDRIVADVHRAAGNPSGAPAVVRR